MTFPTRNHMTHRTPARRLRRTYAWKQLAKQVIREEPLCWLALPGCTLVSQTGDHIIPIAMRPELALVRSNVRGACKRCNYRRGSTPVHRLAQLRRALARADQWPTPPTQSTIPTIPKHQAAQHNPLTILFGQ
jgi:5-methylcytosine-specific restriction endonuclease McrA